MLELEGGLKSSQAFKYDLQLINDGEAIAAGLPLFRMIKRHTRKWV